MAPFISCDHCGRTGVTFGVYYPQRDMTTPAVHLCQTQHGLPIEPNCYHLVRERGEPLGLRKYAAIIATDRHSPRVEATQIRFNESPGGAIYAETVRGDHPLAGQQLPAVVEDPTPGEVNRGLPAADLRPLIDPASPQGQQIADAAAAAEAAKIVLPGGLGNVGDRDVNPRTGGVPARYRRGPVGGLQDYVDAHAGHDFTALAEAEGLGVPTQDTPPVPSSAAQVAAAAQAKVDAAEAARPRKAAAKKATKRAPRPATS